MCKAETGSRLTCITALWLERKEKRGKVPDDDDDEAAATAAGRKMRHKRTLDAEDTTTPSKEPDKAQKESKSVKKRQKKRQSKRISKV